jgi:DNA gyrase subunit B
LPKIVYNEIIRKILENTVKALKARTAGEKARNAVLKQNLDYDAKAKLAVCTSKTPTDCELYIVEGDSAGGTVKTARNRKTQAVLPLRGKILNVEKAGLERVMGNAEIKALIATLGCGIGDAFDISRLRYDKIVILTDADVDGAHIRTLLLTFFYRFLPGLISAGKIYCGLPPLYMVTFDKTEKGKRKKSYQYLFDDAALETFRQDKTIKIDSLQRYKGLGEMDASQLFETTLNPETRSLSRVHLDDDEEADTVTDLLMGTAVPPRREFIMDEASYAVLDAWA